MPLILAIEDEPTTRILYVNALRSIEEVAIVSVGTMAEAKLMLAESNPDLVLLDVRLPDGTGLEVLPMVSRKDPPPSVIVASATVEELDDKDVQLSRLTVLAKPIAPEELRREVRAALRTTRAASPFAFAEYLQMACLGRHSVMLDVRCEHGIGYVAIKDGQVWSARFGEVQGFAAFYALVHGGPSTIEAVPWPEPGEPRQFQRGYEELLLESLRRYDEGKNGLELAQGGGRTEHTQELVVPTSSTSGQWISITPSASRPSPPLQSAPCDCSATSLSVEELVAEGVRAVVGKDYGRAVSLLEDALALEPTNRRVRHQLERLYELGFRRDQQ